MTQALTPAPHRNVRLVRLLSDFALIEEDWPHREFADRLGQMLNFADSILLADAHKTKPKPGIEVEADPSAEIKQAVLHTKSRLVQGVIESCSETVERPKIRWPALKADANDDLPYERVHGFYISHQREQDQALRMIRSSARDVMSGSSPNLQKLATLDRVLEETLWDHCRRFYAMIPALFERRFQDLQSVGRPGWLNQLRKDIQALLLAELDLRLQPVLGLVEAIEHEVIEQEVNRRS